MFIIKGKILKNVKIKIEPIKSKQSFSEIDFKAKFGAFLT